MSREQEAYPARKPTAELKASPRLHRLCQGRLEHAIRKSMLSVCLNFPCKKLSAGAYVRYMLEAMKKVGW